MVPGTAALTLTGSVPYTHIYVPTRRELIEQYVINALQAANVGSTPTRRELILEYLMNKLGSA